MKAEESIYFAIPRWADGYNFRHPREKWQILLCNARGTDIVFNTIIVISVFFSFPKSWKLSVCKSFLFNITVSRNSSVFLTGCLAHKSFPIVSSRENVSFKNSATGKHLLSLAGQIHSYVHILKRLHNMSVQRNAHSRIWANSVCLGTYV